MADMPRQPDERAPLEELDGALRAAVEQARGELPPAEAVLRALDRAQRLGPVPRRRWWGQNSLAKAAVAGGIAALLLVGLVGLWTELPGWAGREKQLPDAPVQVASGGREWIRGTREANGSLAHEADDDKPRNEAVPTEYPVPKISPSPHEPGRSLPEGAPQPTSPVMSGAPSQSTVPPVFLPPVPPQLPPQPTSPPMGGEGTYGGLGVAGGMYGGGMSGGGMYGGMAKMSSGISGGMGGVPGGNLGVGGGMYGGGAGGGFPSGEAFRGMMGPIPTTAPPPGGPSRPPAAFNPYGRGTGGPGTGGGSGEGRGPATGRMGEVPTNPYSGYLQGAAETTRAQGQLQDAALKAAQARQLRQLSRLRKLSEARDEAEKRYQDMTRARMTSRGAVSDEDYRRARETLDKLNRALPQNKDRTITEKDGKGQSKTGSSSGEDTAPPNRAPQVWHRDQARPTVARVYVGDGNALELVSLQVSVTVEGPRARTVVDHIFHNPHPRQLEGTFEYPLPSGASPSYFAMFPGQTRDAIPPRFARRSGDQQLPAAALTQLRPEQLVRNVDPSDWGTPQEARVVGKEKALEAYEEVVRGRVDPGLLEYAGGNTFSGRVFPIPARGYTRIILAYEELLAVAGGRMLYRFPLPGRHLEELRLSLQARSAECLEPAFLPRDAKKEQGGSRYLFSRTWQGETPEGEVVFSCVPADARVQTVSGRQGENGPHYLYARVRPVLKEVGQAQPFAQHAVFLLDTSLSEHPDRFAVSMKLLRKILESDPDIQQFNVLTFNVGTAWVEPSGWLPNTPQGREKALSRLDGLVLEGATDLSAALDKLAAPGFDVARGTALDCFLLSDGHATWGEADPASLVTGFQKRCPFRVRFHCYRTGLGEEDAELFEALTRNGGGVYQCFGEAEVAAAARAHRRQCLEVERVRFVGGPASSEVLVAGRRAAVYPGGELVVAGKFAAAGRTTLVLEGKFLGRKVVEEFPLEVRDTSELAPRSWAEIAVSALLALNDPTLEPVATAYCQQFGIASRVASFLVLENENDYKRLNLEEERGKTFRGDLGQFLAERWAQLGRAISGRESFERLLARADARTGLLSGAAGPSVKKLLELLPDAEFELPVAPVRGALLHRADVPSEYLVARERDPAAVGPYVAEARRRAGEWDVDGAVRVLSSVIEEHPGRGDALRLVGYRLLDLGRPAQAARLFALVQRQRPFEPHSYRDLARALEDCGRYGLAAVQYEAVLAGTWHARFGDSLKIVCREEYARMLREAIRRQKISPALAGFFGERLGRMGSPEEKGDLRVTITWNTDGTDVDLWVIEPDGTKVFYAQPRSHHGGELSQDQTQGYGPERYRVDRAQRGVYTVLVHYFRPNPNLLGGETHVHVTVTRHAGTPQEVVERHTVLLRKHDEQVEVCKVAF